MNIIRDYDRTDAEAWYSQDPQFFDDSSFEARFVSNQDRRLRWVVGATWYEQEFITHGGGGLAITGLFDPGIPFFVPSGVFGNSPTAGDQAEVWGVFGALSYDFTDKLTLDVELRTMADERTVDALGTLLAETYDSTVPRLILSYQPDADTNIYGQFSKGSLPGRVNGLITTCSPDPFLVPYEDPLNPGTLITLSECEQMARQGGLPFTEVQELDAFEVGIKKSLADGRVNLTAAAYFWDWTAKPSSIILTWVRDADNPEDRDGIPNAFANSQMSTVAGSSEMYGLDLESAFRFTDNWSATLNLSWTETELTELSNGNQAQLTGTSNLKGNEEQSVPKFKGGFSTTYNRQLNGEWGWFTRLDVMYQGDYWADPQNLAKGPAFTLAHARIGAEKDDLRIELFVRNLFDEDTWRDVGSWIDFTPQPVDFNFLAFHGVGLTTQDRRTIGVRMSMSF
jgi:iron complex outermembrane receptor protein